MPGSVNYFQGLVSMVDNHCDMCALFEAGVGPWSYATFDEVGKSWGAYPKAIEDRYNDHVSRAQPSAAVTDEAAGMLKELAQEKTNARCAETRETCRRTVAEEALGSHDVLLPHQCHELMPKLAIVQGGSGATPLGEACPSRETLAPKARCPSTFILFGCLALACMQLVACPNGMRFQAALAIYAPCSQSR